MKKGISRRDFLNGTQVALGASLLTPWSELFGNDIGVFHSDTNYYPPGLSGMRGSHDGSWETMHARVAGGSWDAGEPDEQYDLVVVGGGISGLSAAWFYRQRQPQAKILIVENHDDFGGHAKRNEFIVNGQTRIGYGGTEAIDTPSSFGPPAMDLLQKIGIRLDAFYEAYDASIYSQLNLSRGILFDQQTFGQQKLAVGYALLPWNEFVLRTPLSEQARKDLIRLQTSTEDYLPGLSLEEKQALMQRISYETFLRDYAKVDPQIIEMYRKWGTSFWCVGIDEIPASQVQEYEGMPGTEHSLPRHGSRGDDPYIFHFPDGNATIARLLVRSLIPAALPGKTQEDSVLARLDYSQLDKAGQAIRIRLNSTAVQVQHTADESAVDITYVNEGNAFKARAKNVVMACYNLSIPYLCPEMPQRQKEGLAYGVKVPLSYVKVAVPNWRAMADLGLDFVNYTNDFYKQVELDFPVSIGGYECAKTPNDPMILHMCHVPFLPDVKGPEQWRQGRRMLLQTPFSTFEYHVRDQLDQALAGGGFDADRDIVGITVNRWPHGYAYESNLIWEPKYAAEADKPWVIGRQPFGRIHIANSDADSSAMTQAAIMQAWRAVGEIE
ncbi:MAG: FAD/NAD(P)-binding protein [Xanthomonadales bacterium]|nr:FAD/NAD(P)-binding protein [Xanthomonadales bacterium]